MKAEIVKITPELAKQLLKNNVGNRKLTNSYKLLVRQMKKGLWKENGESFVIDKNGSIRDGQHRLNAVIEANHEYYAPLITDVEPDVMDTIDTGKNRSLSDVLSLNGFSSHMSIAAITKNILLFDNGYYNFETGVDYSSKFTVTNSIGLNYALNNQQFLYKLNRLADNIYIKQTIKVYSRAELGLYLYIVGGKEFDIHHINFIKNIAGINITQGTATSWLYKKLLGLKENKIKTTMRWKVYAMIRAWNIYASGNIPVKHLQINLDKKPDKILEYEDFNVSETVEN